MISHRPANRQTLEQYPHASCMKDNDVVIVGGARTPFCEWLGGKRGDGGQGGRLASISAEELGSIAIKGALEKTGTEPSEVDHVIMGHALQTRHKLFSEPEELEYCQEFLIRFPC